MIKLDKLSFSWHVIALVVCDTYILVKLIKVDLNYTADIEVAIVDGYLDVIMSRFNW